jgi:hypothetical protein
MVARSVDVVTLPVQREGRRFDYVLYLAGSWSHEQRR